MPAVSTKKRSRRKMSACDYISIFPGYDPFYGADEYEFIPARAEERIEFIENEIKHTEGPMAGKPYILAPHQRGLIYMIWGWYHRETGFRRIKEVFYYVPRKNSKSTDCAVILNTELFTMTDWRQQLYSSASGEKQAGIVYKIMRAQIKMNPEMLKRVRVYESPKSIVRLQDDSIYQPLPDNADVEHGKNVHFALCDETHTYKNDNLIVALETGMVAQDEPLLMHATTADYIGESVCNSLYDRACKVRDKELDDPEFLPIIYEADKQKLKENPEYWQTEECWKQSNPLYGITVRESYLRRQCRIAIDNPAKENEFKRLHCNIQTETSERMISSEVWALNNGDFPPGYFDGKPVVGASLDLSSSMDTTSFNLLFDGPDGGVDSLWFHWIPRKAAQSNEKDYNKPFSVWERDGWITVTDGGVIHYDRIRVEVLDIVQKYGVKELFIDPLFQAKQIAQQFIDDGLNVTDFRCSPANVTAPLEEFMRLVGEGKFRHGNNPLMRDQSASVTLINRGVMKIPGKAKSTAHIDGIVTAIMSTAMALRNRTEKKSVYEDRGALTFDEEEDT